MMKTKTALALASIALFAALTGCGSRSADPQAAASTNAADQGVKFAQCMREHGIPMKDPKPGEMGTLEVQKKDQAKMMTAVQACEKFSPAQDRAKQSPEDLDKEIKLAQCMRSHGIAMEDPKSNGGSRQALEAGPKTLKAHKACAKQVGLPDVDAAAPKSGAAGR
jgi:hypothetical protein